MVRNLYFKALFWANSLAHRIEQATSKMLEAQQPFSREDMRDEIMNRYPA